MLGMGRKAIVFTTGYVMQWGAKEGHTVGLPEKHYLMLKYIADKTPYSMHAFCLDTLLKAIENKALEISKSNHKI
jgi:hypothetical protein